MRIELVDDIETLTESADAWTALLDDAQGGLDLFQSPQWLLPWWRHLGQGQRLFCMLAWQGDRLVGLAPLVIGKGTGGRIVRFMGDPLNDYNGFVLRRGCEAEAGQAILKSIMESDEWDRIDFDCIFDVRGSLGAADNGFRPDLAVVPLMPPPTVLLSLPGEWEAYRSGPVVGRRTLERKERKLRREAKAEFRVCEDGVSVSAVVPELERLRHGNWTAFGFKDTRDSLLFGDSFSAFLNEACPPLADSGRLKVGVVEGESGLLAAGLYLAGGDVLMKYMQGWDHTDPASSVGLILDWLMIRHAIESGLTCFDFGRGDETYKSRLGGKGHPLTGFRIFPAGVRGRLAWARAMARHSARRVKQRLLDSRNAPVAPDDDAG